MQHDLDAEINYPDEDGMRVFAQMITDVEPFVHGIWGFLDGCNLPCQESSDPLIQNAYYNSWKFKGNCISNILLFTPDGCIALASYNLPGKLLHFYANKRNL